MSVQHHPLSVLLLYSSLGIHLHSLPNSPLVNRNESVDNNPFTSPTANTSSNRTTNSHICSSAANMAIPTNPGALPTLTTLPQEILHEILTYLPLSTLISFALTNHNNYILATSSLHTLDLSIFPRRIHSILAFLHHNHDHDNTISHHQISQTTSPLPKSPTTTPASHRIALINSQNALATEILSTPTLSHLRSLTLHLYELTSPTLASTIATRFPHLHHLTLSFSHPYIHDPCLPLHYWTEPPKSTPAWNALAGIGPQYSSSSPTHHLTTLRTLSISRAGLTSTQLTRLISSNPHLHTLHLHNVTGVDETLSRLFPSSADGQSSKPASKPPSPARSSRLLPALLKTRTSPSQPNSSTPTFTRYPNVDTTSPKPVLHNHTHDQSTS